MVFYSLYLLQNYQIYINIEICNLVKTIKYIYKYIFKDNNQITI